MWWSVSLRSVRTCALARPQSDEGEPTFILVCAAAWLDRHSVAVAGNRYFFGDCGPVL